MRSCRPSKPKRIKGNSQGYTHKLYGLFLKYSNALKNAVPELGPGKDKDEKGKGLESMFGRIEVPGNQNFTKTLPFLTKMKFKGGLLRRFPCAMAINWAIYRENRYSKFALGF